MYRCQLCGNNSSPHTPAHKLTVTTRPASYPTRERVNACHKRRRNKFGDLETKFVRTDDPGGRGYECVTELTVCPACAASFQAQQRGQPEPLPALPKALAKAAHSG